MFILCPVLGMYNRLHFKHLYVKGEYLIKHTEKVTAGYGSGLLTT
jgi:hypothetical protein